MKTIFKNQLGIDTNIIIYALNKDAACHSQVASILSETKKHNTPLFLSHQNILEAEQVLTKVYKISQNQAIADIQAFMNIFNTLTVRPRTTTLQHYHRFLTQYANLDIFDTYLAATFLDNGISYLLTENVKDFRNIKGFTAVSASEVY